MTCKPPLMLDPFSGTGGASSAFKAAGWRVVTVDNDPQHNPSVVADLNTWSWWDSFSDEIPTFVWASPPCTEFSRESMPWCRTGKTPDLGLVFSAMRIIAECQPKFW